MNSFRFSLLSHSYIRYSYRYLYYSTYHKLYNDSISNSKEFWKERSKELKWKKECNKLLDSSSYPTALWFPNGEINITENILEENIKEGRGNQAAIIFHSDLTDFHSITTYNELYDKVSRFSSILKKYGCFYDKSQKNIKTVVIYMSNSLEAVIAMLACARNGIPHSVVFGGFAAKELAVRIKHAKPSLIIASSCGIEPNKIIPYKPLLDEALQISGYENTKTIIYQRPQCLATLQPGRDFDWEIEMKDSFLCDPIHVPSSHPLYILYTSGTTGIPKGVVRDTGGYATALKWSVPNVFGVNKGEVFWAASDVGWVVGHSYITYGPLLAGCTSLIYEGKPVGTPNPGSYWNIIQKYNVKALFCAPTAFRAIKREDPNGEYLKKYDLSCLKSLFLAGERADPPTVTWASNLLKKPVIDNYWQTETGWPIAANYMHKDLHQPIKIGSSALPVPGYDIAILNNKGEKVSNNTLGSICIKYPLPPGCLTSLFNNSNGLHDTYFKSFPNYYNTGDSGYFDEDGYLYIMTRTGDIINVAGHRLSTGRLEEVLSFHKDIAECAVIGIHDDVKGHVPLGLIVLSSKCTSSHENIKKECIQMIREHVGPVAAFRDILIIKRLPKTRSGKILRGTMQKIADKEEWKAPPTTEDFNVFDEIENIMRKEHIIKE